MRSAMSFHEQTLQQVVDATGDGKSYRDDPQPLTTRLKAGEVYAVRCPDSTRYYRSVMLKRNDLTGKFQVFISNRFMGIRRRGWKSLKEPLWRVD